MFNNVYKNKKVLITGHTGFKGSWLTTWLLKLGAHIIGISKDIPTTPSMFEVLNLESKITHYQNDIRNLDQITNIISFEKPDFLFHLAAQPIVSLSFTNPIETISSNVIGTSHILEALRISNHKCTAIIITSDKAYDNVEQVWGYKENDTLGGKDIYSGSKGAAELIIKSYYNSFFKHKTSNIKLAIGRAGNVIGGGDWAQDRIIVDSVKAWSQNKIVELRNPYSTRPWQHVLEPLSGYLSLGHNLYMEDTLNGEAFNFGPNANENKTVQELILDLSKFWDLNHQNCIYKITDKDISFTEAKLLKLNCDKAQFYLHWKETLNYKDTIKFVGEWYYSFYQLENQDFYKQTYEQIIEYENLATIKGLKWTE